MPSPPVNGTYALYARPARHLSRTWGGLARGLRLCRPSHVLAPRVDTFWPMRLLGRTIVPFSPEGTEVRPRFGGGVWCAPKKHKSSLTIC